MRTWPSCSEAMTACCLISLYAVWVVMRSVFVGSMVALAASPKIFLCGEIMSLLCE